MEVPKPQPEQELSPLEKMKAEIANIWDTWCTGLPGLDFPETFNPWEAEEQIKNKYYKGLDPWKDANELKGTLCPDCGLPRGTVLPNRCSTCMGDNFMEPL